LQNAIIKAMAKTITPDIKNSQPLPSEQERGHNNDNNSKTTLPTSTRGLERKKSFGNPSFEAKYNLGWSRKLI
jgi:hypothetical protein